MNCKGLETTAIAYLDGKLASPQRLLPDDIFLGRRILRRRRQHASQHQDRRNVND